MKEYDGGIDLSNPGLTHTIMVNLVGEDKRVVDFGCHTGFVAAVLKDRGCSVVGIEYDPDAAAQAKAVCDRVITGDLDELYLEDELAGEKFDVGLFGDIIEHLKNPGRPLVQMRSLLAPGGYIVVSVPNIAHASIRLKMLLGEFEYEERGILDETHLRFFTRKSIRSLLESCGYIVDSIDCMEIGVPEDDVREALDPLGIVNCDKVLREFSDWEALAFQFIVKAFPASEADQVSRLSEEKVQAELRLRSLERDFSNVSAQLVALRNTEAELRNAVERLREELEKAGDYVRKLEAAIRDKDCQIAQLQEAPQPTPGGEAESAESPGMGRRRHLGRR
jgi:SAM-dependent methyltransferase